MNRSRTIRREYLNEGSERSNGLALALSQIADPDLLEALVHSIGTLQEFGGELYIGAARDRFDEDGHPNPNKGSFETYAYVIGYNERPSFKRLRPEVSEDAAYQEHTQPELEVPEGSVEIPVEDPEPVAAEA